MERVSTLRSQIEDIVKRHHLLKHPFYIAWSNGELTVAQLRQYAGQYVHHVLAEPTYLSAVHSNTPHFASDGRIDLSARQAILANLVDEEFGPCNHPELWKRFARALGSSEESHMAAEVTPATRYLIGTFREICRERPYYAGLAALHAFESQVPAIAAVKIDGLRRFYGFSDPPDYEFFTVHLEADVTHAKTEWELIEQATVSSEVQAEVVAATSEACTALWSFLDGVYATRVS